MEFEKYKQMMERLSILEKVFLAAQLVIPTSDNCSLKKPVEDYQWFIDCNRYPNGEWK